MNADSAIPPPANTDCLVNRVVDELKRVMEPAEGVGSEHSDPIHAQRVKLMVPLSASTLRNPYPIGLAGGLTPTPPTACGLVHSIAPSFFSPSLGSFCSMQAASTKSPTRKTLFPHVSILSLLRVRIPHGIAYWITNHTVVVARTTY